MQIALVFGTRPEAIKLVPVVRALQAHPGFEPRICVTAQHRQMLDQVLSAFGIQPDCDLNLMTANQSLTDFLSRAVVGIGNYLSETKPAMVLVQGDTTSTLCGAIAAYYNRIPLGHVEAGLRTFDKYSPFPEEGNRLATTHLADLHFAPTNECRDNLLREGISANAIEVTGNTGIDALLAARTMAQDATIGKLLRAAGVPGFGVDDASQSDKQRLILITAHRRENFGPPMLGICAAVRELCHAWPDVRFVFPVHFNPAVRTAVDAALRLTKPPNLFLIEPLDYLPFVAVMSRSCIVLTDSGGIQEEAPGLGLPVLVMRDTTERPEAITAGTARLVGTDTESIVREVSRLLEDRAWYAQMATAKNPFGDGHAANRIVVACSRFLRKDGRA